MKTTGVSSIPKFGLLDFLGHPNEQCESFGLRKANFQTLSLYTQVRHTCGFEYFLLFIHKDIFWPTERKNLINRIFS